MPKINKGKIKNKVYTKNVNWNAAVLWKTKEISLPPIEINKIYRAKVEKIEFVDKKKKKKYTFNPDEVREAAVFKMVGQEAQFYWSINLAEVTDLK